VTEIRADKPGALYLLPALLALRKRVQDAVTVVALDCDEEGEAEPSL
jgi:hypothetical protein